MCGWFGWSLGEGVSKPAKETESWVLDHYQVERAVFLSILCRLWPCHLTIHMIWRFVIQKDTYLKPISSSRKTPCIKGCIVLHLFCFIFHKLVTTVNLSLSLSLSLSSSFHALKDECFLRHSLQRQSATLHHATVGYAVCIYKMLWSVAKLFLVQIEFSPQQ